MTYNEIYNKKAQRFARWHYTLREYKTFNYSVLSDMCYIRKPGKDNITYNDVIIMLDTETSKKVAGSTDKDNHIVAWTISIRSFNKNIVTLYGHDPVEFVDCCKRIQSNLRGEKTIMYCHNLAYDWVFLQRFIYKEYGEPVKQLNVKPHYPIMIEFQDSLILKDSLILAQRSLDKWGKDLRVEHQKAGGKWDYDKLRNQHGPGTEFTAEELEYIEHDTLCGVECLDKTMKALNKKIYSMPYTATGIPREEVRKRGKEFKAHDAFKKTAITYQQYENHALNCYHGGFTHGNRHFIDSIVSTSCKDFASSYPYCLLTEKYACERFTPWQNCSVKFIMQHKDNYAFMFKLILTDVSLASYWDGMPCLQFSKCVQSINPVLDNGRILKASYIEIYLTELDLEVILQHYKFHAEICTEVLMAKKDYLPRWFTDYVYECFRDKTILKDTGNGKYDPVAYSLAKAKLNSLYGMCVQHCIQEVLVENYETGEYSAAQQDNEEEYNKYLERRGSILPYNWGITVTSAAFRNLFELGKCVAEDGEWIYSDTDSIYATKWDDEKVAEYNENCKAKLRANGYGPVLFNGREYWPGIAEDDAVYTEFKVQGAKRYCGRSAKDGELHITVAGVPKNGAVCLNDDINNFKRGMVFPGTVTGKKTHTYIYVDDIYTDENGNLTGNSIDLSPCDYLLDSVEKWDWEELFVDEVAIQVYEEQEDCMKIVLFMIIMLLIIGFLGWRDE